MRERTSVVCALVALLGWSHPARAEVVPLAVLEQRAVEKHALIRAGEARTRAADAELTQARSSNRPRLGFNADVNVAPGRTLVRLPDPNGRSDILVTGARDVRAGSAAFIPQVRTGADLTLGANLYDFGRTRAAIAASRAKVRTAKVDEEQTRAEIVGNVRGAYLAWLSAHQLLALSETTTADASRRSARASALVEEGARPRGELAPVEADRLLTELELERARGELEGARMLLEQSVGELLPTDATPDPQLLALSLAPDASESDPSLRLLDAQRAALQASAQLSRKTNAPVLSTALSVGLHAQGRLNEGGWSTFPTYVAGLSLAVPLWDGGSSRAASEAADARADEVRIRLEQAELAHTQALARARLDVAHADKRAETAQKLLDVCKKRIADVEAGYELGAMQFEQVQQARALLRRAETELVMARVARAEAVLRVAP